MDGCLSFGRSSHGWLREEQWLSHFRVHFFSVYCSVQVPLPVSYTSLKSLWTFTWLIFTWSEVKWSEVAQSCPTLCNPVDCSLSGSSIHGILQAGILEWIAISSSRGSSWPRDWIELGSPALQADALPSEPPGNIIWESLIILFYASRLFYCKTEVIILTLVKYSYCCQI